MPHFFQALQSCMRAKDKNVAFNRHSTGLHIFGAFRVKVYIQERK